MIAPPQLRYDLTPRMLGWRLDPAGMFADALGSVPDGWQARALRSPSKRQLYLTSRQAGKSSVAGAKALHTAMFDPESVVLMLSPTMDQSREVFKKAMRYWRRLGRPMPAKNVSEMRVEFINGSRIIALPGSETSVVGYTADRLIIDEAARTPGELLEASLPMVAVSDGSVVALTTPKGARGWFYDLWTDPDPRELWERYRVPANLCPRIPESVIEEARAARGDRHVRQEFFCSFEADEEAFFRAEDVDRALTLADPDKPLLFPEAAGF